MTKCRLCGSTKNEKIGRNVTLTKKGFDILRCKKCGTGFGNPMPTEKQLGEFYSSYNFDDDINGTSFLHRKILSRISRYHSTIRAKDRARYIDSIAKKKGSILEIGGARGELLNELKKKGWEPAGVELSNEFIKEGKERFDIEMHTSISEYKNKKFDVIAMFHVLEHMIDPIKEIKKLSKYLSKDGIIVVEVPHLPKKLAYIFPEGKNEFHDSHTYHFNPHSFEIIAKKAGLKVNVQRIINYRLFKSASVYDLFPGRTGPSKIKSIINAGYLVLRSIAGRRTSNNIDDWEKIDYAGHGDFVRAILSK